MLFPAQRQAVDQMRAYWDASMSEVVRRAVDELAQKFKQKQADRRALFEKLAGSWARTPGWKNIDAVKYQRQIRREKGI